MVLAQQLVSGQSSEWDLVKRYFLDFLPHHNFTLCRHSSEDLFGIQLAAGMLVYLSKSFVLFSFYL